MNLFCIGLSHHNADVEAREYFAGHVESDRALRNCGCNEALVLSTCNRVEVYAASEKRVSTDEIARCLVRDDTAHRFAPPFYRYEGEKCVRSGTSNQRSRSIFASVVSASFSSGQASSYPHRDYARRSLGRLSRGRSCVQNLW